MSILHTSDWHLGHTLYDVSREYEHRAFLQLLVDQIRDREIDALLIAGDIIDISNPSAALQDVPLWFLEAACVMDTFPIVRRKDEATHGAYRTKDTILEVFDALSEAARTGQAYQSPLTPPPGDPTCCHFL